MCTLACSERKVIRLLAVRRSVFAGTEEMVAYEDAVRRFGDLERTLALESGSWVASTPGQQGEMKEVLRLWRLKNALVLHDVNHYSSTFIHLWPIWTTLSLRTHKAEIAAVRAAGGRASALVPLRVGTQEPGSRGALRRGRTYRCNSR